MSEVNEEIKELIAQIRAEPDPDPASITEHIHAPFPNVQEATQGTAQTAITYGGAIRAAIDNIITHHNGAVWGKEYRQTGWCYAGNSRACSQASRSHF